MSKRIALCLMVSLLTAAVGVGRAMQDATGPRSSTVLPGLNAGRGQDDIPFGTREIQAHQLRQLREQHQKQVMADSDRLIRLATELKAQTDQGVTASPAELKDVDEIAKLARKLGDRIKNE